MDFVNSAIKENDWEAALNGLNELLKSDPVLLDGYLKRATVYNSMQKPLRARKDAECAVIIALYTKNGMACGNAQILRGISYFCTEEYANAGLCFQWAKEHIYKDKELESWIAKTEKELANATEEEMKTVTVTKRPQNNELENLIKDLSLSLDKKEQCSAKTTAVKATTLAQKVRYDWSQSDNYVSIDIYAKNVDPSSVHYELTCNNLSLNFALPDNSVYTLTLEPLYDEIATEDSTLDIRRTKIEISLKKRNGCIKWEALQQKDNHSNIQRVHSSVSTTPSSATATSHKQNKKNWDNLVAELEEDEPQASGEAALNNLFQQIYHDADDDTRRAMMKSFVESNGTALSTNWNDVGTRKFETKPPKGVEPKKW
ncbi:SGT1-like protein Git7 [Schizosaccharomyces japonicus yFS275]|uniref:SGT1-like protein Git7 n=1 Tax=Schizosaccharomyces japonicus (strain yFS275 / FY16936) TaxID=402676 RepID=B6JW07_SCHJY|nr:SGT1-like protein Git7 [Schizosaccharomyces japonicus yFS275]EEB05558.2 SGT1-like protein Git7 [Schizosaccharomyces japonicus yFS275]